MHVSSLGRATPFHSADYETTLQHSNIQNLSKNILWSQNYFISLKNDSKTILLLKFTSTAVSNSFSSLENTVVLPVVVESCFVLHHLKAVGSILSGGFLT